MKILYFDCFSGISGDMTIAALIDAGSSKEYLESELNKLPLHDEYNIKFSSVVKNGINSTKFDVEFSEKGHEHGENEDSGEKHRHHEHSHHHHTHSHDHAHNHDHHHHRTYRDITDMIKKSELSDKTKELACDMFKTVAISEGKIHGMPYEEVHFHEVGAIDSIIDIVGVAILIDDLAVDKIVSSRVPVGSGHIHIAHGVYPVPAPATLDILKGIPITDGPVKAELTTPTGATVVSTLCAEHGDMPEMTVSSIGYGAGTKTFPNHPNVLRVMIGEN